MKNRQCLFRWLFLCVNVIDVSEKGRPFCVGDRIPVALNYRSLTRTNISPYLNRVYLDG